MLKRILLIFVFLAVPLPAQSPAAPAPHVVLEESLNHYMQSGWPWIWSNTRDFAVKEEIRFCETPQRDLLLDLFLPKKEAASHPTIVFIHGGGWRGYGDWRRRGRAAFDAHAMYFASKGYVAANIQYRFYGEEKFPAAAADVKCAIRWLRAHTAEYKIDPRRIAVAGESAGGHLALLAALADDPRLEGDGGNREQSSAVQAGIGIYPAVDIREIGRTAGRLDSIRRFLGGTYEEIPEVYKLASPVEHVDSNDPPVLLMHGTADSVVPYQESVKMKSRLEAAGVPVELFTAEGADHICFMRYPWYAPGLLKMGEFLARHLK